MKLDNTIFTCDFINEQFPDTLPIQWPAAFSSMTAWHVIGVDGDQLQYEDNVLSIVVKGNADAYRRSLLNHITKISNFIQRAGIYNFFGDVLDPLNIRQQGGRLLANHLNISSKCVIVSVDGCVHEINPKDGPRAAHLALASAVQKVCVSGLAARPTPIQAAIRSL